MMTLLDCPLLVFDTGPLKGQKVRVRKTITIGRHPDNDISIEDPSASRHHARVEVTESGLVLADAESGNGTYLNGEKVTGASKLMPGDRIRIGRTEFVLLESDAK